MRETSICIIIISSLPFGISNRASLFSSQLQAKTLMRPSLKRIRRWRTTLRPRHLIGQMFRSGDECFRERLLQNLVVLVRPEEAFRAELLAVCSVSQAAAGLLSSELPPHSLVDKLKDAVVLDSQPKAVLQAVSSAWRSQPVESSKGSEKPTVKSPNRMDSSTRDPLRSGAEAETVVKEPVKLLAGAERPMMAIPKTEVAAGLSDEVKAEIIFKSELIVRRDRSGVAAETRNGGALPNFKQFRKVSHDCLNQQFLSLGFVKLLNRMLLFVFAFF